MVFEDKEPAALLDPVAAPLLPAEEPCLERTRAEPAEPLLDLLSFKYAPSSRGDVEADGAEFFEGVVVGVVDEGMLCG